MKTLSLSTLSLLVCAAATQAQLGAPATLAVGTDPEGTALADFDGDGNTDLAVAVDAPDRVLVFPGLGDGGFGAPQAVFTGPGTSPHTPAAVDADGDGDLDIAVTMNNQGAVRVLTNNGGVFSNGGSTGTGADPRQLVVAQLDGLGGDDLVSVNRDGNSITVLLANGGGYTSTTLAVGSEPRGVAVGDLDGDGDDDLAVSAHDDRRLDLLLNDGSGNFASGGSLSLGFQLRPDGVVAGDLDGDGDDDLATAASGNGLNVVAVFLQSNGGFGGMASFATGGIDPSRLALADLDVDGDADVLVTNTDSNSLASLTNDGAGNLALSATQGVGTSPGALSVADLDGNGSDDAVVTNEDAGTLSVLLNVNADSPFSDLGQGLAGTTAPVLTASGGLGAGDTATWSLSDALPGSTAAFVLGFSLLQVPFKGGTMVPDADIVVLGLPVSAGGTLDVTAGIPALPAGTSLIVQEWITDAGGPLGFSASNAVVGVTP